MGARLAMRVYESDLPAPLKGTAAAVAVYADDRGGESSISIKSVAWLTGKSSRQARRDISDLCDRCVLTALTARTGGAGRRALFRLNAHALPKRHFFGPAVPRENKDASVRRLAVVQ